MEIEDVEDVNVSDYDNESDEDEDFLEFAVIIAFPRRARIFRERVDHFRRWTNDEFLQKFRLNKNVVNFLAEMLDDRLAPLTNRNKAVTTTQKLLVTLRYYATGSYVSYVYTCADFAGIHKSTAGTIIKQVSKALASLRSDFITFPSTVAEVQEVRQEFFNIAKFPSCVGALDCTHVKIISPGGSDPEVFRNRKNYFSLNIQTICDARLMIRNIVARWPGSAHDSEIFRNSAIKQRLDVKEFGDVVIVADSGYGIDSYIITPLLNPVTQVETLFNESQIRTRNPIERSYGVWKRRFPILSLGINLKLETVQAVIVATAVLHNIARKFGVDEPRVTKKFEKYIQLQNVPTVPYPTGGNKSMHRRRFLNYFATL